MPRGYTEDAVTDRLRKLCKEYVKEIEHRDAMLEVARRRVRTLEAELSELRGFERAMAKGLPPAEQNFVGTDKACYLSNEALAIAAREFLTTVRRGAGFRAQSSG